MKDLTAGSTVIGPLKSFLGFVHSWRPSKNAWAPEQNGVEYVYVCLFGDSSGAAERAKGRKEGRNRPKFRAARTLLRYRSSFEAQRKRHHCWKSLKPDL